MTMQKPIWAGGLPAFTIALMLVAEASANDPSPVGGGRCAVLLREMAPEKLWIGTFSGGRKDQDPDEREQIDEADDEDAIDSDFIDIHRAQACFRQKADCERWIYRLKSIYPEEPRRGECMAHARQPTQPPR